MDENTKIVLLQLICFAAWTTMAAVFLIAIKQITLLFIRNKAEKAKMVEGYKFQLDLLSKKPNPNDTPRPSSKEEMLKYAIEKTDDEKAKEAYINTLTQL